jgi:phosphopantothenoylcysteine decarboxylase / phosphopantothenate---cysteine ligase
MARILLGVSGGIAAYKALELVRLADAAGHSVRVIQTPTSKRFVGAASFEALTGAPVLSDEFERDPARGAFPDQEPPAHTPLSHLELVANADLYLIAPASANTIAKLAHGLADNLLTSAALACPCPLVVAPAMNNHMYEHPATQANLRLLRERGVSVVGPEEGRLASRGEHGAGRLVEPAGLLEACEQALAGPRSGTWAGLHVLVSAGGTREPIDAVRFVGNRSSGRMGFALATAARTRGADVTVVAANVALPTPAGVRRRDVSTAAELQRACEEEFARADVLLMAAAVADFRPVDPAATKIKKAGREHLELELEPTPDVLSALAARRHAGQTLVGFAAEHGPDAVSYARGKLEQKDLDAVVANDVSRGDAGFEVEHNEVVVVTRAGDSHLEHAPKERIAEGILDVLADLRASTGAHSGATVDADARSPRGQRLRAI